MLIEDKASGTQLIQELVELGLYAVTRYQPQADKIMRSRRCQRQRLSRQAKLRFAASMHAQTAMIENGFVHLPREAGWRAEYLHELTVFPGGKYDDQVDSTGSRVPAASPAASISITRSSPRTRRPRGPSRYRRWRSGWASSGGDQAGTPTRPPAYR